MTKTKLHTTVPVPIIKDRAHSSVIYGTEVTPRAGKKYPHLVIGWHSVNDPDNKFEVVNYLSPDIPLDFYRVNAWVVASGHKVLTAEDISTMHHDDDWMFLHGSGLYVTTVERANPDKSGYSHPIVLTRTGRGLPINLEVSTNEAKEARFL